MLPPILCFCEACDPQPELQTLVAEELLQDEGDPLQSYYKSFMGLSIRSRRFSIRMQTTPTITLYTKIPKPQNPKPQDSQLKNSEPKSTQKSENPNSHTLLNLRNRQPSNQSRLSCIGIPEWRGSA